MLKKNDSEEMEDVSSVKRFFKNFYSYIIVVMVTFVAMAVIAFMDVASTETVMAYSLTEYEIGQIADKTIVADKTLPPTADNEITVTKGEKVTRKGFPITADDFAKLRKLAETPEYIDFRSYVNTILYLLMLTALGLFLFSDYLLKRRIKITQLIFIMVLFVACYTATVFSKKVPFFADGFNLPVLIPSILSVMFIVVLVGNSEAVSFSIMMFFAVLNAANYDLVPAAFVFGTSICATRIVRNLEKRLDFIYASILMAVLNIVFSLFFRVIFNAESSISPMGLFALALNGFISGVLVLGLLTPLETILNTASVFRLMDLSDTTTPLLQRLQIEASGTYNHSMMVATLAESACKAIGANSLLARVSSYYHDIGKLDQPEYFTENNPPNENKHIDLNPSLSISIIRAHVKKSIEKVTQMHFPKEVVDIIEEHHGNDLIQYFYNKAKNQDEPLSEGDCSYSGSPPSSKESAVVMLADTAEAACHSIDSPTPKKIENRVHELIKGKMERGQLNNCQLTFLDLDKIEKSFVIILSGYYHSRIKYQNQKEVDSIDADAEKNRKEKEN